jgi:hypothetical protein
MGWAAARARRRAGEKKSARTWLANDSEYMQPAQSEVYSPCGGAR